MILITEDNRNTFPNQFLDIVYHANYVDLRGDQNAHTYLKENKPENAILLLDVMPDNIRTVHEYKACKVVSASLQNVHVIPIPCIEYYFAAAFIGSTFLTDIMFKCLPYKDINLLEYADKIPVTKGYETFCKHLVKVHKKCYIRGYFSTTDCPCMPSHVECSPITLTNKALCFVHSLPAFPNINSAYDRERDCLINRAIKEGEERYYSWAYKFKDYGYIYDVGSLE